MLAGTQCARADVASPEAQTWPAGRYVPSHASCSVFHLQGLRDSTRTQLRLPNHTTVVVGCHRALGQLEQPGRGGRSGCSGAVVVLGSQSPAGSGEAHAGKSMLSQHPQERSPGCHSGGVLCPACGQVHTIRLGEQALGLVVRSGMMLGSVWATQHGSEDGSIPSAWWHPKGRDP